MKTIPPAILLVLFIGGQLFGQQPLRAPDPTSQLQTDITKPLCYLGPQDRSVTTLDRNFMQALPVHKVTPKYPDAARRAHIEGEVVLCAEISREGKVETLRAVAGPPELFPSALEAVKKWQYKPYILNGKPAAVETEVHVNYALMH